jgi:3-hydroxy acid dehydrogenase / malonic semialdehyde reductase
MIETAIITGATSGIGEAIALKFASERVNLVICGRRAAKLKELSDLLKEAGCGRVDILAFDISSRQQSEQAFSSLSDEWRQPDVLINNAGLALGMNKVQDGEISDWESMIDTNIKGLLYATRIVAPWMAEAGRGHIVNIGSIAGREVYPGGNVYCATKFAVDALTKAMRLDMLDAGIRVTQIAPGAVETEFSMVRFKGDQERAARIYQGFTPLTGKDIADIAWYVVNQPSHVNITDILVTPAAQGAAGVIKRV